MKPFKVSLIVPVYNVEKYLARCLESLVSQTLDGVEIVAVNDGSTDSSLSILERFKSRYSEKLFIYTTENHGVSHARNLGFSKARGEYVWFVDSDDYVERDACERLYQKAVTDGNDLVLFRYYKVDSLTGERTAFSVSHYSQNFTISEKPCELPVISPYPWIKFIKYELFEGLAFPEGIRFEDLPIAYLLAVKAASIGVVNECLYNYRKNVGFLGSLIPATLDVKKAVVYLNENMERMGFREKYREELDFIAVRHFFYRFWKMLTNYEKGKKELKRCIVNELFDYMEQEIPDWRENHYVKYFMPAHLSRMLYLYGSRKEMLGFVEACDGMDEDEQKKWLKEYKSAHESEKTDSPSDKLEREKEAFRAYRSAIKSNKTDKKQIFLESRSGLGLDSGIRALLLHLAEERKDCRLILSLKKEAASSLKDLEAASNITLAEPGTEAYGKALARSGCVVTDGPLPYYTEKITGQFFMLLCGSSLYPLTEMNSGFTRADVGLWQHSMLLADCLYFTDETIRRNYMKSCMMEDICPTPYVTGVPPEMALPEKNIDINRELGLSPDCRKILLCPQLLGRTWAERVQAYKSFAAALYQLDTELTEDQIAYVSFTGKSDIDFHDFAHIHPVPSQYDLYDFASACDVFISDYHPGLVHFAERGRKAIRFLFDGMEYSDDCSLTEEMNARGVLCTNNVPELAGFIREDKSSAAEYTGKQKDPAEAQQILEKLLDGKETDPGTVPEISGRPRVLYYSGRKLSNKLIEEINGIVSAHPEKNFWFAFNDFRNTDSGKYTARLSKGCSYFPLKPDMEKGRPWKIAGALISRAGLSSVYPREHILSLGKKECRKYLGNAEFDEVVITSTDNMRTIAILLAAAPKAECTLDTFCQEKYEKSWPYRHQIRFLRRLAER